ncbi:MAG: hypothetical protein EBV06_07195 [Planctomycetia bacterium]|nr:hypothetical protein [Planctomycetia bacterium]
MILLGRFIVMTAFVFWLGGFTFYISIVVPLGTEQLGAIGQGFITREVTKSINISATIALALALAELLLAPDNRKARWWARWGLWLTIAVCQASLFYLHPLLDGYLDFDTASVRERPAFYQYHRVYLWTHTLQWALAWISMWLMLWAWRDADRSPPSRSI